MTMKKFYIFLWKAFMIIVATAAVIGLFIGGTMAAFGLAMRFAPVVVVVAGLGWALMRAAKYAEDEENQAMNLAKAIREQKEAEANKAPS